MYVNVHASIVNIVIVVVSMGASLPVIHALCLVTNQGLDVVTNQRLDVVTNQGLETKD